MVGLENTAKKSGSQLTTNCSQFKLTAADGKKRLTDCLVQDDILTLVESIPSKKATQFIKWLTLSEDTIDGKNKTKAYALFDSSLLDTIEVGTIKGCNRFMAICLAGFTTSQDK